MTPLYGHISPETAYVVDDYPYGFKLRTTIRYWVEYRAKKGFRMVSQTKNPKNGLWNKEKAGTYHLVAMNLYLDEENHVQPSVVNEYTNAEKVLQFVKNFPKTDTRVLKVWVIGKIRYCEQCLNGSAYFTMNGVKQPWSEGENERHQKELEVWREVSEVLK